MSLKCIVLWCLTVSVTSTPKKGYGLNGWGLFQCSDTSLLTGATWWYDWRAEMGTFTRHRCTEQPQGEFVPMIHAWTDDIAINIPASAKYVLGFNEPNQKDKANISPQDAARHWPEIERNAHGKLLVSPAPSGCQPGPNNLNCNMNSTQWLDEFFKACHGCRVDFVAAHSYSCNADVTMRYLENLYQRYKKKIWLTEFACSHTSSETHELNYMKAVLPRLENADFVFRYAWFITRWMNTGFLTTAVNLLQPGSSNLTRLGKFYNNFHHKK